MSATYGLDFERHISASTFEVRRTLSDALRELGFQITVDQLTRVEAKRGGMIGLSLMMKKQMPVLAVLEVSADATGCTVLAHLTDGVRNFGAKTWGMNRQYQEIFTEVQSRLDLGLAGLDGAAAGSFAEPSFWSRAGSIGVLEQTNALTTKAVGTAVGAAGKALEGPSGTTPKVWKGVDSVTFTSTAGVAVLTLPETQARLGVAVMIASHPGSMPPNLARDVEALAAAVETRLTAAGGKAAQVEVPDAQRPVFEFLDQQAEIRSGLPLRQLHICRSCRLEKITNPEYERLAARNEKIGDIVAGVGATIGKGGISPTFVLGQVFKLKKLDPAYVCSRCQGMEADERVVTFCPNCADLARDVVLRTCPKCKFDYRTRAGKTPLWTALPAEADEPEAAAAEAGAAGGAEPEAGEPGPTDPGGSAAAASEPEAPVGAARPAPVAAAPADPPAADAQPVPAVAASRVPPPVAPPMPLPTARPVPPPVPAAAVQPPPTAQPTPPVAAAPPVPPPAPPVPPPAAAAPFASAPPAMRSAWPTPGEVPLGTPPLGQRGKRCQMCHRDYPTLWRVVISTPAGFEERFICGTTFVCQMVSLARAVQV